MIVPLPPSEDPTATCTLACKQQKGRESKHNQDRPRTTTHHHKLPKKPNKNATDRHNTNQQTNERRRREGKKKTGAGAKPWGKCGARSAGCRRSPRPARRDHKGKPKPQIGLGFPQRLRERERKKEKRRRRTNQTEKKERGDTNSKANTGQVLKGTKPNTSQPQRP